MKTVLETELRVLRAQGKTNIVLPFTLDGAAKELKITYAYAPKTAEDEAAKQLAENCLLRDAGEFRKEYPPAEAFLPLKNLITLSLDDPNGYRGAAHRQADRQVHIFTETESPFGFSAGALPAGNWRLVLNVHAVVTEYCDCRIKVEAEGAKTDA